MLLILSIVVVALETSYKNGMVLIDLECFPISLCRWILLNSSLCSAKGMFVFFSQHLLDKNVMKMQKKRK